MRRQAADRGAKRFLKLIGKKSAKPSEPPNIGKILSTMTSSDILANAPLSAKLKVFSPVEAAEFAVSYLHMTLQLIPLRERWGMRKVMVADIIKMTNIQTLSGQKLLQFITQRVFFARPITRNPISISVQHLQFNIVPYKILH